MSHTLNNSIKIYTYYFFLSGNVLLVLGMHKKSLEASKKIREEEEDCVDNTDNKNTDFRSESIAQLRAKAQEHNARLLQALNKTENDKEEEECSDNSFDGSFFSDTVESSDLLRS